jgi:molybdopterin/thiamine biosynthesis adenylyltransferase
MDISDEQLERYSRHILLTEVGVEGQKKIKRSKILIIGAGGLGAPAAFYLAAAGVGTIGIADGDRVEKSNLQRQIIHFTRDIGRVKVQSAREKMTALNPEIKVKTYSTQVTAANVEKLLSEYDFIIDGTDNLSAKFLINDACVINRIPYSHGGLLHYYGQTMTVLPIRSACYRCVFNAPPPKGSVPTCAEAGILGAIAGMLGTVQATEALKYLLGIGELLTDSILSFNALEMDYRKISVKRNPNCPVCGDNPAITELKGE